MIVLAQTWLSLSWPQVNWNAVSAIGTLLAVFVALILPFAISYKQSGKKRRAIEGAINHELEMNYKILFPLSNNPSERMLGDRVITKEEFMYAALKDGRLKIEAWEAFRYELAVLNNEAFASYYEFYLQLSYLNSVVSKIKHEPESPFASFYLKDMPRYAENFVTEYHTKFGSPSAH